MRQTLAAAAMLALLGACDPSVDGVSITAVDGTNTPIHEQDVPLAPLNQAETFVILVQNIGGGTSGMVTFNFTGTIGGDFTVADGDGQCTGSKLGAGDTCMQNIVFAASHEGKLKATAAISTGDDSTTLELDTDVFKPSTP